jgi:ABC-2 type transport system ATP-binding protein
MLQAVGLTKTFGRLVAVDHLNLEIQAGEFFCFLGPNGAGKTTTLKMFTGLVRPTSGQAVVGGFDIQTHPVEAKRLISFVPDSPFLYDKLSPVEFMTFIGQLYDMPPDSIRRGVAELIERFGLQEVHNQMIGGLSHGTRQRVAIAAALLHNPKVFVIDEPLVGLDPRSARMVKDTLKRRSRDGCTVFLSTHLLSVAEELADRIGIISHGRLIACGSMDDLRRQHGKIGQLEEMFLELTEEEAAERASGSLAVSGAK